MDVILQENNVKVLILSRGFRAGDAITTLNLFSKWPKNNLYCASLIDSEFASEFRDFYLMGNKEVHYKFPFNYISSPQPSRVGVKALRKNVEPKHGLLKNLYERIGRPIMQWLDLYEERLSIDLSEEFISWVRQISPDVLYTSIGDIAMARFVLKFHEFFPDIKIVVHGFDDWLSPAYKMWNNKYHRQNAECLLIQILSIASCRFTSSDKMSRDYSSAYNLDFISFPNPVKIHPIIDKRIDKTKRNIVFVGKIGWHNNSAIKDLILALDSLIAEGESIVFDIYTDMSRSDIQQFVGWLPDFVVINKSIPNSFIPPMLQDASALFLPISIDKQTVKFAKYSMSTKMGEYLSSGTPTIYYGPKGIAMTEFLVDHNCAYVVTERNIDIIKDTLRQALLLPNSELTNTGFKVATNLFNIEIIAKQFSDKLSSIK